VNVFPNLLFPFDFVAGLFSGRTPKLSRSSVTRMLEPLHLPLPEGLEYQRRPLLSLCIRDSREQAQRDLPGQSIPELTRLLPGREDQLAHPLIKLFGYILKQLISKEIEAIQGLQGPQNENEDPGLWNEQDDQVHQDNDDELPSIAKLALTHTVDQIAWRLTNDMFGFRENGSVHSFNTAGRIGLQNVPSFGYSPLVQEAIEMAYTIVYRQNVTSTEEYEQGLLSHYTSQTQWRQDNVAQSRRDQAR
jgi:hypothetical protein